MPEPTVQVSAVTEVLDRYDNGEGECEPEDRWRLFRDLRALLSQPTPSAETKEQRLLRRVGEMVEGYEAGGSIAAEMQIIRDEWRKYKGLEPR